MLHLRALRLRALLLLLLIHDRATISTTCACRSSQPGSFCRLQLLPGRPLEAVATALNKRLAKAVVTNRPYEMRWLDHLGGAKVGAAAAYVRAVQHRCLLGASALGWACLMTCVGLPALLLRAERLHVSCDGCVLLGRQAASGQACMLGRPPARPAAGAARHAGLQPAAALPD